MSKGKFSLKSFLAGLGVGILVALGITGKSNQALPEATQKTEENKKNEIGIPTMFRKLINNDYNWSKMQIEYLMEKYPNIDELLREDSEAIRNTDFTEAMYDLYKAYLLDKAGVEVPPDMNGKTIPGIYTIRIRKYELKDSEDELFYCDEEGKLHRIYHNDKDPELNEISREYDRIKVSGGANGDLSGNRDFAYMIYDFLSSDGRLGLQNFPTRDEIYEKTQDARDEAMNYEYYYDKLDEPTKEKEENNDVHIRGDRGYSYHEVDTDDGNREYYIENENGYKYTMDFGDKKNNGDREDR